jgi:hypothetical protein
MRHVKARLGAFSRKLELDDDAILSVLEQETLPTLSIYFPYYLSWILNVKEEKVPILNNTYYLPINIEGHRLIGVEKVLPKFGNTQSTGLGNIYGGILPSFNNYISMKLDATLLSAFMVPQTFTFTAPNMVRLNGEYNFAEFDSYMFVLKTTHPKNFSTFPYGLRETIMKLAFYDVALDVLAIRKYFVSMSTTFGDIDLQLDPLEMVTQRDDLVELMRKNQLKNALVKKVYIA